MSRIRFEAEWIKRQHIDASGERNPDLDEYCASYHPTKEEAEAAAIKASKEANCAEWVGVTEQHQIRPGVWESIRRWTGDWDGVPDPAYEYSEAD